MDILLEDAGTSAVAVLKLWWILLSISMAVFGAVTFFLIWGIFRKEKSPARSTLTLFFSSGIALTLFLLVSITFATFHYSSGFSESLSAPASIEVVGKRWWWEVIYYNEDGEILFKTANEIHIPVDVATPIRLTSDNVIHSFWVPELGKKVDLIPGRTNTITLDPKREGVYRGVCAEYCGLQHTRMAFHLVVQSQEDYQSWKAHQAKEAQPPKDALSQRGAEVFKEAACYACHTIRGLSSFRELGPDLTHLMSRRALAAATIPNNKGHLSGWIADPQAIKPGAIMPGMEMSSKDFEALIHYLNGLE